MRLKIGWKCGDVRYEIVTVGKDVIKRVNGKEKRIKNVDDLMFEMIVRIGRREFEKMCSSSIDDGRDRS